MIIIQIKIIIVGTDSEWNEGRQGYNDDIAVFFFDFKMSEKRDHDWTRRYIR